MAGGQLPLVVVIIHADRRPHLQVKRVTEIQDQFQDIFTLDEHARMVPAVRIRLNLSHNTQVNEVL